MNMGWVEQTDILLHRLDAEFYDPVFVQHARCVKQKRNNEALGIRPLGEIARLFAGPFGSKLPSSLYRSEGIPLYRVQNIYPFFPDHSNLVFLDERSHRDLAASETRRGDLMVAKAGRVGDTCLVPPEYSVANVTEHVIAVRVRDGVDAHYLVAAMNTPFVNTQFRRIGLGTLINYLGVEVSRAVEVPIPNSRICTAIGNRVRKLERLRELATSTWTRARYKLSRSLRVPLEETFYTYFSREDADSREYSCLSIEPAIAWTIVDDTVAAQYYHPRRVRTRKLVAATGSWIRLSEVAARNRKSTDSVGGSDHLIGLDQIHSFTGVISLNGNAEAKHDGPRAIFEPQTILFSRLRPYLNKVAIWPEHWEAGSGSGELLTYRAKPGIDPHYLFFVLKSPLGLFQVIDVTAGSTHPRVDAEVVDDILIPRLAEDVEAEIGSLVRESHGAWYASAELISKAKADVEALIDGTLDEERLLGESAEIERWLKDNPSPHASNQKGK